LKKNQKIKRIKTSGFISQALNQCLKKIKKLVRSYAPIMPCINSWI
jgi:hypothetical protein